MSNSTASKTASKKVSNNVVKTKSKVKTENTAVKKTEKIIFLAENVTGKILQNSKIETNREVKKEIRTFSFAKRYSLQFDKGFYSSFVKFNENDLTPANLLPLRTAKEKTSSDKNGFSAWLFMSLVKRFYSKK
jgi:hypothetical protein